MKDELEKQVKENRIMIAGCSIMISLILIGLAVYGG